MRCTTVCSYQLLKENCLNAPELPFNVLRNFVNCLANYRFCSRIFFSLTKLRRKIALCLSELSLDTPSNFTQTFVRIFIEKSREQRTKFTHFACITFAQYCIKALRVHSSLCGWQDINFLSQDYFNMME